MNRILCSTGALIGRPNGRDFYLLKDLAVQLACDGFEFMMYSSWYEKIHEIIDFFNMLEFCIPVMHCDKHIGEYISMGDKENLAEAFRLFEINCNTAKNIGAGKMVVHLWSGLASDLNFQNNIYAYPKLVEIAWKYGVDVLVENVVCNMDDPMKHWGELRDRFENIHFVYDTKMAAFHGQTELLYRPEYDWLRSEGHICHYHVNDYKGALKDWSSLRTLPIGEGGVDFSRFFKYIRDTSYEGDFTVESTAFNSEGVIDVRLLNRQFQYIREALSD